MAGFDNDCVYGNGADFSTAGAGGGSLANGLFTDGQIWIGSTAVNGGGTHVNVGTIAAGTGISVTNGAGTITVATTGGVPIIWSAVSVNTAMAVNHGYIAISPGGALTFSLPAVSAVGDQLALILDGSTSFTITQGAGQTIRLGNAITTAGVGGSMTSTQQGDAVTLVCSVANLKWNVFSSMGNPTIV